jgi:hypothetical protein
MACVQNVGKGFFPLDEELELLPGKLTPREHERLVRLAGWIPSFEKAAELFGDFLGIEVGKIASQRYSEAAGAAYEQIQNEEVAYLERHMPPTCSGAEKMLLSADGATPHLRWVQVWCRCYMGYGPKCEPWWLEKCNPSWKRRGSRWCIRKI